MTDTEPTTSSPIEAAVNDAVTVVTDHLHGGESCERCEHRKPSKHTGERQCIARESIRRDAANAVDALVMNPGALMQLAIAVAAAAWTDVVGDATEATEPVTSIRDLPICGEPVGGAVCRRGPNHAGKHNPRLEP